MTKTTGQMKKDTLLQKAQAGDIKAFHALFSAFQPQLKSYLYRLTANRNETEDLAHDTFIIAFDHLPSFEGRSSLKTWVFTIATHHARKHLKKKKRWREDTLDRVRRYAHAEEERLNALMRTNRYDPFGAFEIREHIDYCFTCTSKMLPLEEQLALILKDIYAFKVKEIASIMDTSLGAVKHLLHRARKTMVRIFDDQCALVSKQGVCDQCSQLNGRFNPGQDTQAALMRIQMVRDASNEDKKELFLLRTALVRAMDPLQTNGANLHELMMSLNHQVNE
ncbi:MAG: RNA polymerase sigma factor [Rhodothermales bacterium]